MIEQTIFAIRIHFSFYLLTVEFISVLEVVCVCAKLSNINLAVVQWRMGFAHLYIYAYINVC